MGLSCGYKCQQILLIIFNAILLICGICLIVVGSMGEISLKTFGQTNEKELQLMLIMTIGLGCVTFLIGFFGLCGACLKNTCMLITYAVLVGITILVQVGVGIAGLFFKSHVPDFVNKYIVALYRKYSDNTDVQKLVDLFQRELKCCGPTGTWTLGEPPQSCKNSDGIAYKQGCVPAMQHFLQEHMVIITVCYFVFALIQIISMVFAICVIKAIRKGESETV